MKDEWIEKAAASAFKACPLHENVEWSDPANDEDRGHQFTKRGWFLHIIAAALSAVEADIRADERERLAKLAEGHELATVTLANAGESHGHHLPLAYWIRKEVERHARQALKGEAVQAAEGGGDD